MGSGRSETRVSGIASQILLGGVFLLSCLIPALAADDTKKEKLPDDVQTILDSSAGLPPEFSADVLLRLVESETVRLPQSASECLRVALERAPFAQEPFPLVALPGSLVDSESGYRARAFEARLDAISLRLRALNRLGRENPDEALRLFLETRFPPMTGTSCKEPLVPDYKLYFESAALALKNWVRGKDSEEVNDRRRAVLRTVLSQIQSPLQIGPAADLLTGSEELAGDSLPEMAQLLSTAMVTDFSDPRGLSLALHSRGPVFASVYRLLVSLSRRDMSIYPVISGLRRMIDVHHQTGICADAAGHRKSTAELLAESATAFNRDFAPLVEGSAVDPISDENIRDVLILDRAEVHAFWAAAKSRDFLSRVKSLRSIAESRPPDSADGQWNADWSSFSSDLGDWSYDRDRDGSLGEFFHEKSLMLREAILLAPSSRLKAQALQHFIDFLEITSFQRESKIAWFLQAYELIRDRAKYAVDGDEGTVIAALVGSRNPVLNAYGRLAELNQRKRSL